jgi:hypothetical protein
MKSGKRDSYVSMMSIDEYGTKTSSNDNKLYGKIGKLIKVVVSQTLYLFEYLI